MFVPRRSLVTGASAGIGAAFARTLAARGSDLVLVARRTDRLDALANELRAAHGVSVQTLGRDLARPGAGGDLRRSIEGPVDTVINNAGFGAYGELIDCEPELLAREIAVDVSAVVDITRAFLPELVQRRAGAIVNVASTAAFQPLPSMSVYGAAKAFVLSFSEAVWHEARRHGVKVTALAPGSTRTEFFDIAGNQPVGGSQTAEQVVATGMRALDRRNTPPHVVSGALNRIGSQLPRFTPKRILIPAAGSMIRDA